MQLGVLDRAQGLDDVGFGDGHGSPVDSRARLGITPTPVGRIPAVESRPLSPTDFSSAVTAITSAFGDPTRRGIYLFAHEHDRRRDRRRGGRALRAAPQRGPPPPRQAGRRRATSRSPSAGRRGGRRPPVEALPGRRPTGSTSTSPSATTTSSSRCSAGRSRCCRPSGPRRWPRRSALEYGRAMAARDGRRRRRPALVPRRAPRGRRRPHRPRLRRPRREAGAELRIVSRALPLRRRRRRAPGHLRGRPRAWSRACSPASTARPRPRSASSLADGRLGLHHRRRGLIRRARRGAPRCSPSAASAARATTTPAREPALELGRRDAADRIDRARRLDAVDDRPGPDHLRRLRRRHRTGTGDPERGHPARPVLPGLPPRSQDSETAMADARRRRRRRPPSRTAFSRLTDAYQAMAENPPDEVYDAAAAGLLRLRRALAAQVERGRRRSTTSPAIALQLQADEQRRGPRDGAGLRRRANC